LGITWAQLTATAVDGWTTERRGADSDPAFPQVSALLNIEGARPIEVVNRPDSEGRATRAKIGHCPGKPAGQRLAKRWPGAGSNRRPSDFQAPVSITTLFGSVRHGRLTCILGGSGSPWFSSVAVPIAVPVACCTFAAATSCQLSGPGGVENPWWAVRAAQVSVPRARASSRSTGAGPRARRGQHL